MHQQHLINTRAPEGKISADEARDKINNRKTLYEACV